MSIGPLRSLPDTTNAAESLMRYYGSFSAYAVRGVMLPCNMTRPSVIMLGLNLTWLVSSSNVLPCE